MSDHVNLYREQGVDSSASAPATPVWSPPSGLTDTARNALIKAVDRVPSAWLLPPQDGELFDRPAEVYARLQGYALSTGFAVVGGSGSTSVRKNYLCIHHGDGTQNNRKLSTRVEKDPVNPKVIVSSRKRDDTRANALSCKWRWYSVPQLSIDDEGNEVSKWVLLQGRGRESHSHPLAKNGLLYGVHKKAQPEYELAIIAATANRGAFLSHRANERVLWGLNLELDRKTYYNLARLKAMSYDGDGLKALVTCLEQDEWIYRTLWLAQRDKDTQEVTAQVLDAVFFTLPGLVTLARRFCPDWMIQVDGTFKTNAIKMPLIDMIGVTNTGSTFPFGFCFVMAESSKAWRFTFHCVENVVFQGLPKPRVVIADQGLGLRSCWSSVWPDSILQFCEWHAAQNIKQRLAEKKYLKKDREEIMGLVWKYIWSTTPASLEANRDEMKSRLAASEVTYIDTHWVVKEAQVIRLWTETFPNLDCYSTQRNESIHPIIKTLLNPQLRLDQAVLRLFEEMTRFIHRLKEKEMLDQIKPRRILDTFTFYSIRGHVASWALLKIGSQWDTLCKMKATGELLGVCQCGMIERFALPCRHTLERSYDERIPIPLTLIHPRWWYDGPIEERAGWRPRYIQEASSQPAQSLQLDRPTNDIATATNELIAYRDTLDREAQERLDSKTVLLQKQLLAETKQLEFLKTSVPHVLPQPIEQTFDRKAKSHDKTTKRSMLGVEVAVQQADKEEVAAQQADVQVVPNTPPGRKRTHTLVERTPGKPPTPPRAAPAPDPSEPHCLPPSTAPAVLYKGKGGRERKRTAKAAESKARGYLPESQPRE